jgi:superfamily I DNA/RNA helicase
VADDFDERQVIWPDLKDRLGWASVEDVSEALREIAADYATLAADDPDWAKRHKHAQVITALDAHKRVFRYMLRSELVFRVYRAIVTIPNFTVESFDHVLVDEYQDLTALERRVIRLLADQGATVYAAGDDDQAIYGWRGASAAGIRDFESDYGTSAYLPLKTCQRCDTDIVGFSQNIIVQDSGRLPKQLVPRKGAERGSVECFAFANQTKEAEGVRDLCVRLRDTGCDPGQILVLVRGHRYAGTLMAAIQDKLPVASTARPYEAFEGGEGRIVVLYLRLLSNEDDNLAWRELLHLHGGFGDQPLLTMREEAARTGRTYVQVLNDVQRRREETFFPRADAMADFMARVLGELQVIRDSESGVIATDLETLASVIPVTGSDLLQLLRQAATEVEATSMAPARLRDLPQVLAGQRPVIDEEVAEATGVRVMTMHNAKGLTADAVVLAAAEHEVLHGHADPLADLEEVRLIYVSVTRARHHVVFTFAGRRTGGQAYPTGTGSRRLSDVLARAGLECAKG